MKYKDTRKVLGKGMSKAVAVHFRMRYPLWQELMPLRAAMDYTVTEAMNEAVAEWVFSRSRLLEQGGNQERQA